MLSSHRRFRLVSCHPFRFVTPSSVRLRHLPMCSTGPGHRILQDLIAVLFHQRYLNACEIAQFCKNAPSKES